MLGHLRNVALLLHTQEAANTLRVVLQCIFGCDFLSPCTTKVSSIENYPSCSDDLAQLLPCLHI